MKRGRGRPRINELQELITLEAAVLLIQERLRAPRAPYSKKTLQNKMSLGQLGRYGAPRMPMVDKQEILDKLCKAAYERRNRTEEKAG